MGSRLFRRLKSGSVARFKTTLSGCYFETSRFSATSCARARHIEHGFFSGIGSAFGNAEEGGKEKTQR